MTQILTASIDGNALASIWDTLNQFRLYFLVFVGFSAVIFIHEVGHFLAAKWCDVRIDRFAVGFLATLISYRRGIGVRFGSTEREYKARLREQVEANRPKDQPLAEGEEPTDAEIARAARELKLGETEYCFNALPLGGYVKMLGQEDFAIDKSGELQVKHDPRAFTHKPIRQRMFIVASGVLMNFAFAAFLFMVVFMIGMDSPSADVGMVMPGTPADRAGIRMGDLILSINGRKVADRQDLVTAVVLSDPNELLRVKFARKDPASGEMREETVAVQAEILPGGDTLKIGVAPPLTNEVLVAADEPSLPPDKQLQKGDKIVAVEGKPVSTFYDVENLVGNGRGQWMDLTVQKWVQDGPPDSSPAKGHIEEKHVPFRARMLTGPTGAVGEQDENLLGFVARRAYNEIMEPNVEPISKMRRGDVIVRWGGLLAPRMTEIRRSIRENPGRDIQVTVLRGGKEEQVTVRPKPTGAMGRGGSEPLLIFELFVQEADRPVVADIVTEAGPDQKTPAAVLRESMPRGSLLTKINDQAVATWNDVLAKFIELAGQDVKVSWVYGDTPEQNGTIHVPQTLETALHLPQAHVITSVNGVSRKEVEVNGRRESCSIQTALGEREILRDFVGQEVTVDYALLAEPGPRTAKLKITPEMLDNWMGRVKFTTLFDLRPQQKFTTIRERNPAKAMMIGIWKTYYFIENVYVMMQRMLFTRTVSMSEVSGPVGIIKMGGSVAGLGYIPLLYFLAMISANLAVINFMPLPIVDGGLFAFLLIEKIKGKPISLRVQVATQVIGLALILCIFAWVTFQDIKNW